MKLLVFTTLYPNDVFPRHGVFVETRVRKLTARHAVETKVVAPVPWFPFRSSLFGHYGKLVQVARQETRSTLSVVHPRYAVLPKIGMSLAPLFLAVCGLLACRRLRKQGFDFDVVDAHYFYPDGVAAAIVGGMLDRPVVISARGSDINVISHYRIPKALIGWAARRASHVVTVSDALRTRLVELGADEPDVTVVRNGVDAELFIPPSDRSRLRTKLEFTRTTILSVGRLVALKGHDLVIRTLDGLPEVDLVIIGDGPERSTLRALARDLGVGHRVTMLGSLPQEQLKDYYGAADILVLASSSEGWPNVLLECMACGTPVVATRVGGIPEIVTSPVAGELVERDVASLRAGILRIGSRRRERADIRAYALGFGWNDAVDELHRVLSKAASGRPARCTTPDRRAN